MKTTSAPRIVAFLLVLTLCLSNPAFALRGQQQEDPSRLTGLEEALKDPAKVLRRLAQLVTSAPSQTTQTSFPNVHLEQPYAIEHTGLEEEVVVEFIDSRARDPSVVGGKGASLAELATLQGVQVPEGFTVGVPAYERFLEANGITPLISDLEVLSEQWIQLERDKRDKVDFTAIDARQKGFEREIAGKANRIREAMRSGKIPQNVAAKIREGYQELLRKIGSSDVPIAVRSSATAEDLPSASFAGQQDTFLNQRGIAQVMEAVKGAWVSLYGDRAIAYRNQQAAKGESKDNPFRHGQVKMGVVIQRMVPAAVAGVAFTVDPATGDAAIVITANYGLGESVVSGQATPDRWIFTPEDPPELTGWRRGEKQEKVVPVAGGTASLKTSPEEQNRFSLSDEQALAIARLTRQIGVYYKQKHGYPYLDTEFLIDEQGEIYFVQARPETAWSQHTTPPVLQVIPREVASKAVVLIEGGITGSGGVASGRVRILKDVSEIHTLETGDILVTKFTTPDWQGAFHRIVAVITEIGGDTSHAAIASREVGIPSVLAMQGAMEKLSVFEGQQVTLDANHQVVYPGVLKIEIVEGGKPRPRVPFTLERRPLEDKLGERLMVARPGWPLSRFQHELYLEGLKRFAQMFGQSLTPYVEEVPEGYKLFAEPTKHRNVTAGILEWDIHRLEQLFEERKKIVSRFYQVAERFRINPSQFEELVDATADAIAHFNLRFPFLGRVTRIGHKWLEEHPEKVEAASRYRAYLEQTIGSESLSEKTQNYAALLQRSRPWMELFEAASPEVVMGRLAQNEQTQELAEQIQKYANDYELTERDDMREPVPVHRVVVQLQRDFKEYRLPLKRLAPEEEPQVDLTDEEKRLIDLYHALPLQREEEHILYQRYLRKIKAELLRFGEILVSKGVLGRSEEVLNLGIEDLRDYIGQFSAGLEEAVVAKALSSPDVQRQLSEAGFAPVEGGFLARPTSFWNEGRVFLQGGLEEPLRMPKNVPIFRTDEATVGGMLEYVRKMDVGSQDSFLFNGKLFTLTQAMAVLPLPMPASAILDPRVRPTALEIATILRISRQTGTIYVVRITQLTFGESQEPLLLIQIQA